VSFGFSSDYIATTILIHLAEITGVISMYYQSANWGYFSLPR
jgi:hypothetical protein